MIPTHYGWYFHTFTIKWSLQGYTTMQFMSYFLCQFGSILFNVGKQAKSMRNTQRISEWRSTRARASSMEIMFSFTIIISWIRSSSLMVISLATKPTSSPFGKWKKTKKLFNTQVLDNISKSQGSVHNAPFKTGVTAPLEGFRKFCQKDLLFFFPSNLPGIFKGKFSTKKNRTASQDEGRTGNATDELTKITENDTITWRWFNMRRFTLSHDKVEKYDKWKVALHPNVTSSPLKKFFLAEMKHDSANYCLQVCSTHLLIHRQSWICAPS